MPHLFLDSPRVVVGNLYLGDVSEVSLVYVPAGRTKPHRCSLVASKRIIFKVLQI